LSSTPRKPTVYLHRTFSACSKIGLG
jgi:hypothetical protein